MSGSIGGVDASIPLQAGKGVTPAANPLAMVGQYAAIQNALNRNKLFPGEQRLQQQAIQGGALGLAQKTNQAVYAALLPYINDPTLNHDKLTTAMAAVEHSGIPTGGVIARMSEALPGGDGPEFQQAVRSLVGTGALTNPQEQINYVAPGISAVNQGDQLQGVSVAPQSSATPGAITPQGQGIAVGQPSASQLVQPTTGPAGAMGQPTTVSLGTNLRLQGLDAHGNPLPNPAFANLPPGLRNPNAPPAAVTPIETGVGPGHQAALSAAGTQSSSAYQNTSDQGVKAVGQRALLQSMAQDATQFTTGPGAENIKNTKAIIQRISPKLAEAFGIDPSKIAANEDLDKIANQLADAQGAGSDARLSVNQGANPSAHNTPAGLQLILNKLTGNADYLAARAKLAAEYQQTQDPTGTNARLFETKIGSALDPRVFQYNRLSPPQKKQYLSEMSDADKNAFKQTYFRVKDMGALPGG